MENQKLAKILKETSDLLEIKGVAHKPRAYKKAALALGSLEENISDIYKKEGIKGIKKIPSVGKSIAEKIEEYLKKGRIKYTEDLRKETAIRQLVTYYFKTKGLSLKDLKNSARKRAIVYSRYTKPAKQLLELAGSIEEAKKAINIVSEWAASRDLDYTIETVFKKWLELGRLKPKEIVKKPYFQDNPMVWSETKRKWFVIDKDGRWLEFAGKESEIEWRIAK